MNAVKVILHRIVLGHWPDWRIVRAPEPPYIVMWRYCFHCGLKADQ